MSGWHQESFAEFINNGNFKITDAGPLHSPVRDFTVYRNDDLKIVLELTAGIDATSSAVDHPPGSIRWNTDKAVATNPLGVSISFIGVISRHINSARNFKTGFSEQREEATVQWIESTVNDDEIGYTVDWLENIDGSGRAWPDLIRTETNISELRLLGQDKTLTMTGSEKNLSVSRRAVRLFVSGVELYLCAGVPKAAGSQISPGCIVYVGAITEDVRKKIRECLSFSLGIYLVYLGYTNFSEDWKTVSFKAVSAYSVDKKVFALHQRPPAPLDALHRDGIDRDTLSRLVNKFFLNYEALKFGQLNWAYWHALCAPAHIAAVHFGAAIEFAQRNYVSLYKKDFTEKLLKPEQWKKIRQAIESEISNLGLSAEYKHILQNNIGLLNQIPRRLIADQIFRKLNIKLGADEQKAWRRRHDAAHGNEIAPGSQKDIIRDNHLLEVILHRLVLSVTDASESYIDYCSLGFPVRKLSEPAS